MHFLIFEDVSQFYPFHTTEYADFGTYWVPLFSNRIDIVCFDSFGIEHVPNRLSGIKTSKLTFFEYKQIIQ